MKTLLILSGGIEAADAAKRAKEMGLYVVVSDRDVEAPGFAFSDSCLIADVYSPDETAAAAERFSRKIRKIDGVICVAADAPATLAAVADRLALAGITREGARLASDKLALNECFLAAGLPVPWFSAVATVQALQRIAIERGSNLIIKPADSHGGRGVQRISQVSDLERAFRQAQQHSPTQRVMVEEYVEGTQISTESLITGGRCFTPAICDRDYNDIERSASVFSVCNRDLPSRLPPEVQAKVKDIAAQAASALGIVVGTLESHMIIRDDQPYIVGVAARLSGGFFCTREIPLSTGVDFVGAAINVALGEPVPPADLEPRKQVFLTRRYVFSHPGRVVGAGGAEAARSVAGVEEAAILTKPGDVILPSDVPSAAATVLAKGATREAALAAANEALSHIRIEMA
jgi:biotin carboxylase